MEFTGNIFGYASSVVCSARPSHPSSFLDELCSGSITSRPSSNQIGPGGYPCSSSVSSERSSLPGPFLCLRAHGRPVHIHTPLMRSDFAHSSWLIDNDRDVDGMQVIADLHGGDLEDPSAKAEFQEIKDRVNFDVNYHWFFAPIQDAEISPPAGIRRSALVQGHVEEVQAQSFASHVLTGFRSTGKHHSPYYLLRC